MQFHETDRGRKGVLPAEIHADLVETLFGTVGSFLSGVMGGLVVPTVAWLRTGDPHYLFCWVVIFGVTLLRVAVLLSHKRQPQAVRRIQAARWERLYGIGAVGFMWAIGLTAGILLFNSHDELTDLYGVVSVLGCAGSLAGRNAGRPVIVRWQVMGVCGPIAVAMLLKFDAWYFGLSFIFVLIITSVMSTTHFLNSMLVSALLSGREALMQRKQLSAAMNSMTHGLCMTAEDGSITIVNRRLRDFFQIDDATPVADLGELIRIIVSHGGLRDSHAAAFEAEIVAHAAFRGSRMCTHKIGACVFLFRFEPMDNGGSVMVVEDVTKARQSAEQVERLAHFDTLTGLTNRFQFHRQLQARLADPASRTLALLSIDLDRFKEVNDTLGHPMGDKLLQQVAHRLRQIVTRTDTVARFGGDEFQIATEAAASGPALDALAAAVVARLSDPYLIDGHAVSIGASVGIAVAPRDAADADDLLKCADMALYKAKGASRGTFRHFMPELEAAAQHKRQIEQELQEALVGGQLEVFYQPAVDVRTGRITTCEALIRWRHPVRGMMPPDSFIPVAEDTGLIADIGEFVLRRACEDARSWPPDVKVAVNVSAKQFLLRQDFSSRVAAILTQTGLPARRLEVEITESTLLDAKDTLAELAALGLRISLDDFGTGYSSLSYLRNFAVHKIKIDRSFILKPDHVSLSIIDAVSFLADALNVELVVEGVETQAQLRLLVERRIHLIQGYLFSRPRPLAEILPLLSEPVSPQELPLRHVA